MQTVLRLKHRGLVSAILVACVPMASPSIATSGATQALTASRVYTAPGAEPIDDGVVLIRDGKIVAVGPAGSVKVPSGMQQSECSGGIVTAGFQNSHVHFTEGKWDDAAHKPADQLSDQLDEMLNRYGFTTVVDTASALENTVALRKRIEKGEVRGPRILTAGWALYPHDGIPFYLLDMPPAILAQLRQPATVEEAVREVRANLRGGADATKLFVATPVPGRVIKRMSADVARAAAAETHKRGALVLAHPTDIDGIRTALDAKVDVIVHTTLGDAKLEWDAGLVHDMISANLGVVPTLQLWGYELKKAKVPERIIELATGDTVQQLHAFASAGGQVLFGTDVGYMTAYDPSEEFALMARAMAPAEILSSLTTAPAARWNESKRRGRVEKGMDADLVVLTGDPIADPKNFTHVRCTLRAGTATYRQPPKESAP